MQIKLIFTRRVLHIASFGFPPLRILPYSKYIKITSQRFFYFLLNFLHVVHKLLFLNSPLQRDIFLLLLFNNGGWCIKKWSIYVRSDWSKTLLIMRVNSGPVQTSNFSCTKQIPSIKSDMSNLSRPISSGPLGNFDHGATLCQTSNFSCAEPNA